MRPHSCPQACTAKLWVFGGSYDLLASAHLKGKPWAALPDKTWGQVLRMADTVPERRAGSAVGRGGDPGLELEG